jgi:hypothetical protein
MSCRGHTNIAHISASIGFCTHVDWGTFAQLSEYYTHLKPVTLLNTFISNVTPAPHQFGLQRVRGNTDEGAT